jgi:DNA mismatch repair protein MutS2
MIELCEAPALVLLDEVGTGTDPEEGSALGIAVVDHFRRPCGAHVIATTHYAGLKMYATNDENVINASVEFDEKTLRPTYRLILGLAGSSSGLEIARRFGIPTEIIGNASQYVSESSRDAAEYLNRIKRDTETAEELRVALEEERAAVAEKFAGLDKQAERREIERQASFARELRNAVDKFDARSRELLATVQDRAERLRLEREAQKRMAELKREMQQAVAAGQAAIPSASKDTQTKNIRVVRGGEVRDETRKADTESVARSSDGRKYVVAAPREIAVGDRVRLRAFGSIGIVDSIKGRDVEVRVKSVRMREKLANLELMEEAPAETTRAGRLQPSRGTEVNLSPGGESGRSELNVIGQTTDEATDSVDKFLDASFVNGSSQLRIIHGHGTGALRRAIGELLKSHPHVARFAPAPQDQGGSGATLVELKQ